MSFRFSQLAAALLPAFTLLTAQASGYHFGTQSVSAQSTANSSSAEADDASTLFYNPAGLTHLDSNQISASVNLVAPNVYYNNASATYTGGGSVSGSTNGNLTKDIALPPTFTALTASMTPPYWVWACISPSVPARNTTKTPLPATT